MGWAEDGLGSAVLRGHAREDGRIVTAGGRTVEELARAVGLTRRRSRNWRMAEEITARLRLLDPHDPVKYDFALCHKRMSGDCPGRRDAVTCAPCGLRPVCAHWRGVRIPR